MIVQCIGVVVVNLTWNQTMKPIEFFILVVVLGFIGWFIGKCFKGEVRIVGNDIQIADDSCDFEPIPDHIQFEVSRIMRDAGR